MNLDQCNILACTLFELLGYRVVQSSTDHHSELDIDIVNIELDKQLSVAILDELTLAAQTILRATIEHQLKLPEGSVHVSLNINNHLISIIENLRQRARMYADKTMTFGVPVRTDPLPAFHRKIIHTFLQNTPGISTESFGVGKDRHIVVSVAETN
jgi:hypothetical protein